MKKMIAVILALMLAASAAGCSSFSSSAESKGNGELPVEEATESGESSLESAPSNVTDGLASGDYTDTGKGTIVISTPSGTSENGNVPYFFCGDGPALIQMGIRVRDFDGSKLSYIYVDGKKDGKEQYADTDGSVILTGDLLSVGTHKVEVVQYDTDKPDGKIVTYKTASYEVKAK
jgi:ABC-type Fe3+-hydroxamate transport system substrate-binding protein